MRRNLDNCCHIAMGVKLGKGKPKQNNGKCAGYKKPEDNTLMYACERCKLYKGN